ncbi:class I SAM-dependent methyltransferase [Bacillus pseudomycoides]|uniref:SAM-dependent methyltransferase n=1 Tax=Bacillus pseudomycoides TaxID=64104 RepID=A0A2C3XEL3_9BACI|nr:SAM-dependent methyltransferase [Bacillus pseudomycoides]PDY45226.1 SAM-dependent methyltransferase [Bacillus pseudomycoides]PEA82186.1 SAM-dependent methyltransferase [Bacillus pseudomycoides]PED72769.1 SAM-dependent methyltransferase [Bacillus pseudomycoides]PEI41267.1 SAM-dependent methyltransferase [Bacillus pseudomycoides]PEJ77862.1 SAM-dependent methyltransferase [Bacillus pseudomycoides]
MVVKDELKIVVGAGEFNNNPGWLHTNEEELNLLKREDWIKRFNPNSLTAILAEHVWEHLSYEEGVEAAKVCYEFLKNGGYIRCAVPDSFFPDEEYQEGVQVGGPGPLDHPAASHKIVHNYKTMSAMFESAGFQVKLLEYCDESGEFHYTDWDEEEGFIYRSKRFDHRNQDGKLGFVSLIVDAVKGE